MIVELTDDEMVTLREAFDDVGSDCPGVDWDKFKALGVKLGFWEAEKPLTAEEIASRQEFAASPYARQMAALWAISNEKLEKIARQCMVDGEFFSEDQWSKDQTTLRVKLPNDYQKDIK